MALPGWGLPERIELVQFGTEHAIRWLDDKRVLRNAVASSSIAGLDWAGTQRIRFTKDSGATATNLTGLYPWKGNGHVWFESRAERDELMWLDFEDEVERVYTQPFAIAFGVGSPQRGHIPDFVGVRRDGRVVVYDVRPKDRIDDKAKVQFGLTAEVCKAIGWLYRVLDGRDSVATANLNWFWPSRRDVFAPSPEVRDRLLEASSSGKTRMNLARAVDFRYPRRILPAVDHLIWHRDLVLDLDHPVTSSTELFTNLEAVR